MVRKLRFIEPGNYAPYRKSIANALVYNKYIRNPSTGLITLATIAKRHVDDTLMYSESISRLVYEDIVDADILFFSLNTFNAMRGYRLAAELRDRTNALIVFGGMHASLHYTEAVQHCDYVLLGDGDESIVDFIRAVDAGAPIDFPGVAYERDGQLVHTGARPQPLDIDTIPDRHLVYNYHNLASRYDTLWPQVHASRGCLHNCAYCGVVAHFGRQFRTRTPQNVVQDIREAIAFHKRKGFPRLNTCVWITDDHFTQDRAWAVSVLWAIIDSGVKAHFSVQARFETGFDDELLALMKQAGFFELALGIEFLDDASFVEFNKQSTYKEIERAVANIRRHGIGVRGLFIVGAESDTVGVGDKIAQYVKEHHIHGALVQSMFFVPGTPVYEQNKDNLIHEDWDKYCGHVVHYPKNIKPHELQREIIRASAQIYSVRRLLWALIRYPWIHKVLFLGEFMWQRSYRKDLRREMERLRRLDTVRRDSEPAPIAVH